MSSTTSHPLGQLQDLQPEKKSITDKAADRTLDWGGGLLAAVKAGAVQDHVNMLNASTKQVELDRQLSAAAMSGASMEDLQNIVKEHYAKQGEEDDMGINVQGDTTYNIIGGGENLSKVLEKLMKSQPEPQPVHRPDPVQQKPVQEVEKTPESLSEKLLKYGVPATALLSAGAIGVGGYALGAKRNLPPMVDPAPQVQVVTPEDIQNLHLEIKGLKEAMDPDNWELQVLPPGDGNESSSTKVGN